MRYFEDENNYDVLASVNEFMADHPGQANDDCVTIYQRWQQCTGYTAHNPDNASLILEVIDSQKVMDPEILKEMVAVDRKLRKEREEGRR